MERTNNGQGAVEFLLRRIRRKGDLPAFSKNIIEINSKLSSMKALGLSATGDLANVILKDFALTHKLLRIVNSAVYGNLSGKVVTISKAVLLLGFEKVRMIASALMIFEHLQNKNQATELKEVAMASFMSGVIAMDLAGTMKMGRTEEAFICGMLHNLGKLLVLCYFPDEYEEIKKEMLEKEIAEDNAVHSVLGISYNELGMAVSRSWNFPETIVRSMEVPPPGVIDPPRTEYDILRNLTNYANDLCDIVGNIEDENWGRAASRMANRYQKCIPLPVQQMDDLLASAANKIDQFSEIVRIDPTSSAFIKKLSSHIKPEKEEPPEAISETVESGKGLFLETLKASPKSPDAVAKAQAYIFASGVNEIADAMKSSYSLSDVMYMILETMYRACEFNRVIFCLRDVKEAKMVARFGLGEGAEKIVPFFQIDMGQTSDVFNIAINKGRGVVIEDADAPTIARSLPAWYRTHIGAPAFLVYPLVVKGNCIGLFYADKDVRGSLLTESQQKSMDDLNRMAIEVITQKHG